MSTPRVSHILVQLISHIIDNLPSPWTINIESKENIALYNNSIQPNDRLLLAKVTIDVSKQKNCILLQFTDNADKDDRALITDGLLKGFFLPYQLISPKGGT